MHDLIEKMFRLDGRYAFVTGGASNLGRDSARILAAAGAAVAISSRDADKAKAAAAEISSEFGVPTLGLALDQSRFDDVARAAREVLSWSGGRIDVLVNNAGGGSGKSASRLFERDVADIDAMLRTNLNGTLYCCREFGGAMARQGSGSIINIASVAALVGRDRRIYVDNDMMGQPVDYAAAKAGVLGITRDMAAYVGPQGVRVNAISPGGFARSDMQPGFVKDYSSLTVLGRMGEDGADLNGAILYLASDASAYVTGQNLVVDGGFSIFR